MVHVQANISSILQALVICEKTFGQNHLETASTQERIAIVYQQQGKYKDALRKYGKVLKIKENLLGRDHLDVARTKVRPKLSLQGAYLFI